MAWALFAFAGAYHWTLVPLIWGATLLTLIVRPRVAAASDRAVDFGLVACLVAVACQLAPLPLTVRRALSPAAAVVDDTLRVGPALATAHGTSLDSHLTAWALVAAAAFVLTFWSARTIVAGGGLRHVVRGLTACTLALATITFVQRAHTPHLIYGFWAPITRSSTPLPLGPFVNRNDFAAWLMLALPLVAGYGLARVHARAQTWANRPIWRRLESVVDVWNALIAASILLMAAALVASLSRSGLVGAVVALITLAVLARLRAGTGRSWFIVAAGLCALLVAVQYTNLNALAFRLGDSLPADVQGRWTIWQSSWRMARDFIATGVGLGAFERGMLVYQEGPRDVFFNHAHNEYLQLFAEGGLLVGVPLVWTSVAVCRQALRRVQADRSPAFWMRAGGLSGMAAVAVQSLSDTGLRMPANAILFAIAAAVALHDGEVPRATGLARRSSPGDDDTVEIPRNRPAHITEPSELLRNPQATDIEPGQDGARAFELSGEARSVGRIEHEAVRHERHHGRPR